jgi:hypothetical protein
MLASASGGFEIVLTPQMMALVPAIAILLQILKGVPAMEKVKPWFPLISLGVAIALAMILKMGTGTEDQLIAGITMGLATSGGYDVARMQTKSAASASTQTAAADRATP